MSAKTCIIFIGFLLAILSIALADDSIGISDSDYLPINTSLIFNQDNSAVCESAWMHLGTCINPARGSDISGWYKLTDSESLKKGITEELWASPDQCDKSKGDMVGTVTAMLSEDGLVLSIDADLNEDCNMSEMQVWASHDPVPSKSGYGNWHKTDPIKFSEPLQGEVYLAIHCQVCCSHCAEGICTYKT